MAINLAQLTSILSDLDALSQQAIAPEIKTESSIGADEAETGPQ